MQDVMDKIDCHRCVVTADSMNTQKETAIKLGIYCLWYLQKEKIQFG